uniref:Uncharacterized protein n=1 Tax=Podoviridae sp. ct3k57 TaxID=2825217 RepID=A0A8S5PZZ6_9CAUD|nr:MAG TPA: hypothetical protein [Podoviridae sp. ct3k57]
MYIARKPDMSPLMTRNSLINGRRLFHQYFPPALKIT